MAEHFLKNDKYEIQQRAAILEHNLTAVEEYEQQVMGLNYYNIGSTNFLPDFAKTVTEVKENQENIVKHNDIVLQLRSLLSQIEANQNINLTKQLKQKTEIYKKINSEKMEEARNNACKLNAFKKAIEYFTLYYQYNADIEDIGETDKYCVVFNFIVDKQISRFPIKFMFDKNTDKLQSFDAGGLLTEEEHTKLHGLYQNKEDRIMLLCILRNMVIAKQNEA